MFSLHVSYLPGWDPAIVLIFAAGCAIFHQCLSDVKLGKLTNINIKGTKFHKWLRIETGHLRSIGGFDGWQGR